MKRLVEMAQRMLRLQKDVAKRELALSQKREELRLLTEMDLPEAMEEEGVESFILRDGSKVAVAEVYHASISEANRATAFAWLRSRGFDSIIKRDLSLQFGKGEDSLADTIFKRLAREFPDRSIKDTLSVHPSTLKAFVRERVEEGDNLPMDAFGVHIRHVASVKPADKTKRVLKPGRTR